MLFFLFLESDLSLGFKCYILCKLIVESIRNQIYLLERKTEKHVMKRNTAVRT